MTKTLDQRFADSMGQLLGPDFPKDIALAVSGGGDSMAMLALAHNWTRVWGVRLWVVTVDHQLRPESAGEARMVAEECALFGWPHATLRWQWDGKGNVMDAARRARLLLIDQWRGTIEHVMMAHTQDDVAETFLMRLRRGSGVDGLSAMRATRTVSHPGTIGACSDLDMEAGKVPPQFERRKGMMMRPGSYQIMRPCLDMTRAELRHYLTTLKGRWVDDPTNENNDYERARIRKLLPVLAEEGLDVGTLAATAHRMTRSRAALSHHAARVWREIGCEDCVSFATEAQGEHTGGDGPATNRPVQTGPFALKTPLSFGPPTGDLLFDRDGFDAADRDTQLRLLSAALQWVSSAEYRPRLEPLEGLLDRLLGGGGGTLHGCEARAGKTSIRVFRELRAVQSQEAAHGSHKLWDKRWRVFSPAHKDTSGIVIRALGAEGWAQAQEKRAGAPPFHAARSLPSLWQGDTLIACDALGFGPGRTTKLCPFGKEYSSFERFLLSH